MQYIYNTYVVLRIKSFFSFIIGANEWMLIRTTSTTPHTIYNTGWFTLDFNFGYYWWLHQQPIHIYLFYSHGNMQLVQCIFLLRVNCLYFLLLLVLLFWILLVPKINHFAFSLTQKKTKVTPIWSIVCMTIIALVTIWILLNILFFLLHISAEQKQKINL